MNTNPNAHPDRSSSPSSLPSLSDQKTSLMDLLRECAKEVQVPKPSPGSSLTQITEEQQLILDAQMSGMSLAEIGQILGIDSVTLYQITSSDLYLAQLARYREIKQMHNGVMLSANQEKALEAVREMLKSHHDSRTRLSAARILIQAEINTNLPALEVHHKHEHEHDVRYGGTVQAAMQKAQDRRVMDAEIVE